jgi:hypothetical protein
MLADRNFTDLKIKGWFIFWIFLDLGIWKERSSKVHIGFVAHVSCKLEAGIKVAALIMSCYQNFFLFVYRLSYVSYDG